MRFSILALAAVMISFGASAAPARACEKDGKHASHGKKSAKHEAHCKKNCKFKKAAQTEEKGAEPKSDEKS